jgi:hypothetical protein
MIKHLLKLKSQYPAPVRIERMDVTNSAMRLVSVAMADKGVTVVMFHPGGVRVESFGEYKMAGMLTPEAAVGKKMKTIGNLTIKDSGRFLNGDGQDSPW